MSSFDPLSTGARDPNRPRFNVSAHERAIREESRRELLGENHPLVVRMKIRQEELDALMAGLRAGVYEADELPHVARAVDECRASLQKLREEQNVGLYHDHY